MGVRRHIPQLLVFVGILLIVLAATLLHPVAGIATAGVSFLAVGFLMDDGQP